MTVLGFRHSGADFGKQVAVRGGEQLRKCFQCGTCSGVCPLSPVSGPFPRKEMLWSQRGLKERLVTDVDVWLCHQCGDCSDRCPRGARPGDVLSALRSLTIQHFAFPGFMGRLVAEPKLLPALVAIPTILVALAITFFGSWSPVGADVLYERFFPHLALNVFYTSFTMLVLVAFGVSLWRFWAALGQASGGSDIKRSVWLTLWEFLKHSKFSDCTAARVRHWAHLAAFYGFMGLLVTTILAIYSILFLDLYPLPLEHPFKILGNISALIIFAGCTAIVLKRMSEDESGGVSDYFDWLFIGILYGVVITGIATQFLRFASRPDVAYPVYFIHLVLVFGLFIYAPYGKFAHVLYRFVAVVHAKRTGRDPMTPQPDKDAG